MNNNDVSNNLIELYKIMYNLANSEQGKSVLSKELLKLTKVPVEEVERVLRRESEVRMTSKSEVRQEIKDLDSNNAAIQYFKENVWSSSVQNLNDKANSFSTKELRMLYMKIVGINMASKNVTKSEIINKIMDFVNAEIRTKDLAKDLY